MGYAIISRYRNKFLSLSKRRFLKMIVFALIFALVVEARAQNTTVATPATTPAMPTSPGTTSAIGNTTTSPMDPIATLSFQIAQLQQIVEENAKTIASLRKELEVRVPLPVRLVDHGIGSTTGGWLEIFHNGRWGTVCDDWTDGATNQPDDSLAQVVCRMLGRTGGRIHLGGEMVEKYGVAVDAVPSVADEFRCHGNETSIFDCPFEVNYGTAGTCGHGEDLSI